MKFLQLCFLIILLSACTEKKIPEKLNPETELQLSIFGRQGQDAFSAYFNVTPESKDTLYVSGLVHTDGKALNSLKKIKLKQLEIDTLFRYFQRIKEHFKFDDNNAGSDGTKVRITIANHGKSATYFYTGLDNAGSADPQIDRLIRFINARLPKDNRIY